nr:fibroblast growth factor 16-like [Lytechinus pictus]
MAMSPTDTEDQQQCIWMGLGVCGAKLTTFSCKKAELYNCHFDNSIQNSDVVTFMAIHLGDGNCGKYFASLYIQSQRRSIVSIKGLKSQLYVCVDDNGNLYGNRRVSRNCYFQEKLEPNFFNTYAYKMPDSTNKRRRHRTLFLSINKYGESRIAKVRTQKKAQFIPLVPPTELL